MTIQICMILCQDSPQPDLPALIADFSARFGNAPQPSDLQHTGSVASFKLGQVDIYIAPIEASFPWSDLSGPCESSILWKDATNQLRDHKSHIIVTVSGADAGPEALSTYLTQTAVSTMHVTPHALGVFWSNAAMIIPKDIFTEFAEKVLPEGPPLDIWVDFRVGWNEDKTSSGFTTGMHALGHKEFEVTSSPEKPSELRERLESLAYYVLENGSVLNDGDTLGVDENEKLSITHEHSQFGQSGEVIVLHYPASKKKSFWKMLS